MIKVGAVALLLLIGLGLFLTQVEPPHQLDLINRLVPGDSDVARVAEGVVFDPDTGLKLDVWAPSAPATEKRPVLVFFYGGGWAKGERAHYGFAAKAYAARGFVVVVPDYRKVPDVRFPAFNQDGAKAVKWVRDTISTYGGDPERVALAGHSAGAYIAMMLTLDRHYLAEAGVDPRIVKATVGLAGPYDFLPLDTKRSIEAMGQWPRLAETQPIAYARADAPPVWLATGTEDDTVKPRNAILLAQRLKAVGAPVTFRAYPGLSHEELIMAISKPFRGKAPVLEESVAFLLAHLKVR